jgi:transposase
MLKYKEEKNNMSQERRKRRIYTDEFKKQIVSLYNNGKAKAELVREYDLTASALDKWIADYNKTGSFKAKDNRSEEENRLIQLEKENKQLKMENDILKQAALIMGRK